MHNEIVLKIIRLAPVAFSMKSSPSFKTFLRSFSGQVSSLAVIQYFETYKLS